MKMTLTLDTVNIIAWMCGLEPFQFLRNIKDLGGAYEVKLRVYEELEIIATITQVTGVKDTYYLWFKNTAAKKKFKPFIQILKRLAEQGDIILFVTGGTRQASLI